MAVKGQHSFGSSGVRASRELCALRDGEKKVPIGEDPAVARRFPESPGHFIPAVDDIRLAPGHQKGMSDFLRGFLLEGEEKRQNKGHSVSFEGSQSL